MIVRSVTFKFLAFVSIFSIATAAGAFFLFREESSIPLSILPLGLLLYTLGVLAFFLLFVANPLFRIVHQIEALLTGKEYRRVKPSSADEIGIVTHFFNKITLSLESIAGDMREKKRITSELDIARKIQQDILPSKAPDILGLDIVARSRPAAEVGGDSFDFLQRDYHTMFYIGDVTGHGVPAGIVMTMVNTLIHAFAQHDLFPHEILTRVNSILHHRLSSAQFMTLLMMRWDEKRQKMFYIGAGHEYILVYRAADKTIERIPTGGIALRMAPEIDEFLEERHLHLDDGDVLLLYTDGITEGKNPEGDMYRVERLEQSLKKHGYRENAEKIFDAVTKDFSEFMGDFTHQEDDITMVVIKKLPPEEKASRTPIKLTIEGVDGVMAAAQEKRWDWEKK